MEHCSIAGCKRRRKYIETGWCQTHYHRYWRTGSLEILPKEQRVDISYTAAHSRVRKFLKAATKQKCIHCGATASEWAYDGTDESERSELIQGKWPVVYSVWPEFYMPLCFPCHRKMDAGARAERRTHCVHGHEMTPENTYTRPSRPGTRECKECKAIESSLRYQAKKAAGLT